jgi:hypothetical protein
MSLLILILLALLTQLAYGSEKTDLRRELRRDSEKSGLALAEVFDREVAIVPFDNAERYLKHTHEDPIVVFGNRGSVVGWYGRASSVIVFESGKDNDGTVEQPTFSGFWPMALDEKCNQLAFIAIATQHATTISLRWSKMDLSSGGVVTTQARDTIGEEMAWSGDCKSLVYEMRGRIYVFDTGTNLSRPLVSGHSPTWSPDGKWIAYRSTDGQASLVIPNGEHVSWPGKSHKIVGAARWSPDGRYVIFSELVPQHVPVMGVYYRLVVSRIRDGATVAVRDFGQGSAHTQNFHWILNYRRFCGRCAPGQPFN